MHSMKQLWRRWGRTVCGILLVTMAVASLVLCLGQSLAAGETLNQLEYDFTTLAMYTGNYHRITRYNDGNYPLFHLLDYMNLEAEAWLAQVIEENPHLVEGYSQTGLASAYIPGLIPEHYMDDYATLAGLGKQNRDVFRNGERYALNQDTATFVVRIEEILPGEVHVEGAVAEAYKNDFNNDTYQIYPVVLNCTIEEVVSISEAHTDPTGWPIELCLQVSTQEQAQALDLEVGQRYMVTGINYYDNGMEIGLHINSQIQMQGSTMGPYDSERLYVLTEEDKETWLKHTQWVPMAIYGDKSVIETGWPHYVDPETGRRYEDHNIVFTIMEFSTDKLYQQYLKMNTAKMTVVNSAALTKLEQVDGQWQEIPARTVTVDGQEVTLTLEEYVDRYGTPTIARLDGTLEEFLRKNPDWQTWLDCSEVNLHSYPVFAVDKLDYIPDFNRGTAKITQGRDFTQEELETGTKVCIISEQVAQINGLQVGDTLPLQFYDYDLNLPYTCMPGDHLEEANFVAEAQANAAYFHKGSSFAGEPEEYTVIGLYRQSNVWEDYEQNNHAFTPNTVFAPKQSVDAPVYYCDEGLFNILVLKNGCYQEFDRIIMSKEYETLDFSKESKPDMFAYTDQGYTAVKASAMDYMALAKQVLLIGLAVYGIILVLFLLLYPLSQGKTVRIMASLGTPQKMRWNHVTVSALGILVPGTVLGAILGYGLWGTVVSRLLTATSARFGLALSVQNLLLIALTQLAIAAAITALLALPMAKRENLMQRK